MFFFTFPEFPDCERLPSLIETSQVPPVLLEADGNKCLYYVLLPTISGRRTIRTVLNYCLSSKTENKHLVGETRTSEWLLKSVFVRKLEVNSSR